MKKYVFLLAIMLSSISVNAQKKPKLQWRGLYAGVQTISVIKQQEQFFNSAYLIAIVGAKRFSVNAQVIVPVPYERPLIKFGIDFKLF